MTLEVVWIIGNMVRTLGFPPHQDWDGTLLESTETEKLLWCLGRLSLSW